MENDTFWSEIGSEFGELGGTPPPRITRSTPWEAKQLCLSSISNRESNGRGIGKFRKGFGIKLSSFTYEVNK